MDMVKRYQEWIQYADSNLNLPRNGYAAIGLLLGVAVGGVIGAVLFGITGQPVCLVITGVFGGVGLSLGAGIDQHSNHS